MGEAVQDAGGSTGGAAAQSTQTAAADQTAADSTSDQTSQSSAADPGVQQQTAVSTAEPQAADSSASSAGDDKMVPHAAMMDRVKRAKQSGLTEAQKQHEAFLMETFGTTDRAEIAKQQEAAKKLREEAEERKRAEMSEIERHQADLAKERKRREEAEARIAKLERQRIADQTSRKVRSIAVKHVDETSLDYVSWAFAKHVASLTDDERNSIDEKSVSKWFMRFVKNYPKHAKSSGDKTEPVKRKVTNGPAPNHGKPTPVPGAAAGKTPRPGQSNSMSKKEVRDLLRQKGLSY